MCGIFGGVLPNIKDSVYEIKSLARYAEQRGCDSSGLILFEKDKFKVKRGDVPITELVSKTRIGEVNFFAGHSRLATNGIRDNQPVFRKGIITIHNGIICNADDLWEKRKEVREQIVDSEIIPVILKEELDKGMTLGSIAEKLFSECEGVISAAALIPESGALLLFSNNGSLYTGAKGINVFFSSEMWPLNQIGCQNINQVIGVVKYNIPPYKGVIEQSSLTNKHRPNFLPNIVLKHAEEKTLEYFQPEFKKCTCCILPETMPYIQFDEDGVCNYCHNYTSRNQPKNLEMLHELVAPYRRERKTDCIVPFSGGRDSCYSLHLIVEELKMNPVAYTYDWGMITDLGRRNISRMCSKLQVENIIIAADIERKRSNIHKNLSAWLKRPHLGMISLLTAGDKHFFKYVETVKKQTGISLNLWGINPLEITHFKTGFLGIPPAFAGKHVYSNGALAQLNYQSKRFYQMCRNPNYFNNSIYDTLSGEYWRSIHGKTDYFHVFDFWEWNENKVDNVLASYNWEWAEDINSSWRIGDATAAFYNYIYYTVAGFTEHDTFRSNQIREGVLNRDEALILVNEENKPRYGSIKWYLDAVNIDFSDAIRVINNIPKLYNYLEN